MINRARLAWRPGVIAALPVAAMLALGTLLAQPVAAVTLGVGAMLVGVAWRAGDGPATPPLGTMAAAAVMLTLSTVIGTVTGRWPWLHLATLFVLCVWAGLSSALGRRGSVVGTQTLIAFIVFGRFPESLVGGLRLAGLVLGGACAQLLFAALVGAPLAWRRQRRLLRDAYAQLAAIAGQLSASTVSAAEAFDAADAALAAPALFGDPQRAGLVTLVAEGRRLRLELLGLRSALAGQPGGADARGRGEAQVAATMRRLAAALELIVEALDGADPGADPARLDAVEAELRRWSAARESLDSPLLEARLAALGGQVRAAVRQTATLLRDGTQRTWRLPHPSLGSPHVLSGVAVDAQRVRDALSFTSPAGRHAIRLAVVVAAAELISQRSGLPRAYWAVVAAATVLRPNFGDTITRGAERMLGTLSGAVIATFIAVALDPSGWGIVITVGVLALLTYTVFSASFAAGVSGLTAMIVFLLHGVAPDSATIALDRGLDTIIGGALGLVATLVWPTWSGDALPRSFAVLVAAQRDYLVAVLTDLVRGERPGPAARPLARHVRVAFADADTTIAVARSEPDRAGRGLDPEAAAALLAALRRVTYAIHALRLLSADDPAPTLRPRPELSTLAVALQDALDHSLLQRPEAVGTASLRGLLREVAPRLDPSVSLALDELVDAVNSAATALPGPGAVDSADPPSAQLDALRVV
ncbi:MAG TPA: FUSC family protein [Solirubrobacteraceae bacterium]|nr:FUSC family protein [Solirubrobacteraceae bacterium]